IEPLLVSYEDLAADHAGTVIGILRWLGIPGADAVVVPPTRLSRQSDARNEDWLQRYTVFKKTMDGGIPQAPAPEPIHGPLSERIEEMVDTIPPAWQQWIGQSKLLNVTDEDILAVLTRNGYSQSSAATEVAKANSD